MKQIIRFPRPKGSTYINANNPNHLTKHILIQYISNDFRINKEPISLEDLGVMLNISYTKLIKAYLKVQRQLGKIYNNPKEMQDRIWGSLSGILNKSSNVQGLIQTQFERILRAQGDGYKPFITSEVNKLLITMLQGNKFQYDMVKGLMPSMPQANNIFLGNNVVGTQNNQSQNNYLTIAKATELIQTLELGTPMPNNLADLPEVLATKQPAQGAAYYLPEPKEIKDHTEGRRELDFDADDIEPNE